MTFEELLKMNDGPTKIEFEEKDIMCFVTIRDLSAAIIRGDFDEGEKIIIQYRNSNEWIYLENKDMIMNTFNYFDVDGMQYKDFLGLAIVSALHGNCILFYLTMVAITYKLGMKQIVLKDEYQALQKVNSMAIKISNEHMLLDVEIHNTKYNTKEELKDYLNTLQHLFKSEASETLVKDDKIHMIIPDGFCGESFITFTEYENNIKAELLSCFTNKEKANAIYNSLRLMELETGTSIFYNYEKLIYDSDDSRIIKFSREFDKESWNVAGIYMELKKLMSLPNRWLSIQSDTNKNDSNYKSSLKMNKGCLFGILSLLYPIIVIVIAVVIGSY